jgi:hypothetical protein
MARREAESSCAFKIFWLKQNGYLRRTASDEYGSITWTHADSSEDTIGFIIQKKEHNTPHEQAFITLKYTNRNRINGEMEKMDYSALLTTTPCRYGGVRYWFICPLMRNGVPCRRRVGVLYTIGKYFGCRYCGNVAYSAQSESKRLRGMVTIPDVDAAEAKVKRKYYRGQMTRKYKRFLQLERKFEYGFLAMAGV